jgi:hypothetical protein
VLGLLAGCGGPSKEEQKKNDEQGTKIVNQGMKNMMQEQGVAQPANADINRK